MKAKASLSRRDFLKVSTLAGIGLVIGIYLPGCVPDEEKSTLETRLDLEPNVFLSITNQGEVIITVHRSEMGQGVRTALPMIIADELGADWSSVRVEQAPADSAYGDQHTGGSRSIERNYQILRKAGAVAREMLLSAAAQIWEVSKDFCRAEAGKVIHDPTGRQLTFAELVPTAINLPVPDSLNIPLKAAADFQIIGTSRGRVDNPDIVTGRAVFGADLRLPGMLFAVVSRPPVLGSEVLQYADNNALAVPGVRAVVEIDSGVAVVAESTWAALQGRNALEIEWSAGESDLNSADVERSLVEQAQRTSTRDVLVRLYTIPLLAHACMEPMNCTADVGADSCQVWVPTQNPQSVKDNVLSITQLPENKVEVHVTLIGGGFGRRLENAITGLPPASVDYVREAVQISRAVGAPVQVFWTRADDIQHDLYHPLSVIRVSARLDDINSLVMNRYQIGRGPIPNGFWRAVSNVADAFAHECFMDEFAAATQIDPVELRRSILSPRAIAVLELAAEKGNWGKSLPDGSGQGIAYHSTWNTSHVAQVAEVSVDQQGLVKVHRVVCAVDCGTVINPDILTAQMEGGMLFGISSALKKFISITNGRVQQSNFFDYPILRMDEIPEIEVYIIPSQADPTGAGEMANPPIIAAVANAVFAATGKRIYRLPILPEELTAD